MTIPSLLLGTFIAQVLFVITKVFFINSLNMDAWAIMVAFFVLLIVETIAVVRRMGTLNYVESFFLSGVWLITLLIVDYIITSRLIDEEIYTSMYYWMTYLVIILSVIFFHKKLHVQVRKANANK
jgi:hypothetical protein